MQRRVTLLIAALAVAAAAALALWFGRMDGQAVAPTPQATRAATPTPTPTPGSSQRAAPQLASAPARSADLPAPGPDIYGFVLDRDGSPVAGARVERLPHETPLALTEPNGQFSFPLDGSMVVRARSGEVVSPPAVLSAGAEGRTLMLQLADAAVLRVQVLAASTSQPLPGASVQAKRTDEPSVDLPLLKTDEHGWAEFVSSGHGRLEVRAWAPGHGQATRNLLSSSASTGVRTLILPLPEQAVAQGTVRDASGAPVGGATVTVRDCSNGRTAGNVASDAAGRFRFGQLYRGCFRFEALAPQIGAGQTPLLELGRDLLELEIVIERGRELRGRVTDGANRPAAGVLVRLAPQAAGYIQLEGDERQQVSDVSGGFAFLGLRANKARVTASLGGWYSEVEEVDLTLARSIELRLQDGDRIRGNVVDAQGMPIPEARVEARSLPSPAAALDPRLSEALSVVSNDTGEFEFTRVRPGQWELYARAPDDALSPSLGDPATRKTVASGSLDVSLVVPATGALEGWVELESGSVPSEVVLIVAGQPLVSPSGGSFFFQGIPAGIHRVLVTGPEFQPTELSEVEIRSHETTSLERILVQAGRTLRGRVVDAAGSPVAGAQVIAGAALHADGQGLHRKEIEEQPELRVAYSDQDGAFELLGLKQGGAGALVAAHPERGRSTFVPLASAKTGVELTLRSPATIVGSVTRGGAPLEGFAVLAQDPTHAASFSTLSGADGQYRLDAVPPGDYTLTVANRNTEQSYGMQQRRIKLQERQTQQLDFDFENGSVSVVLQPSGPPVAGHSAVLRGPSLYVQREVTDGSYNFSNVSPGQYLACLLPQAARERPEQRRCLPLEIKATPVTQIFRL
jgi:protocatechuate 3,4-dioxygenase beta subunit